MHELGISIAVAKVSTEGSRASDVFYVTEADGSKLASGSFLHDGMVIVPCSSNTLAQVAHEVRNPLTGLRLYATIDSRTDGGLWRSDTREFMPAGAAIDDLTFA